MQRAGEASWAAIDTRSIPGFERFVACTTEGYPAIGAAQSDVRAVSLEASSARA
jgi:hypothetical protein